MEEPLTIADYQPNDTKVPIICAVVIKTAVGKTRNPAADQPTHQIHTKFVLVPFEWKGWMGESKCVTTMGEGILGSSRCELYSGDEVVSTFPINGFAYLRPCEQCKDPVITGYEINGVRTMFFGPDDVIDGCCENYHPVKSDHPSAQKKADTEKSERGSTAKV